jgi:NAD(P)-dependent dehydrogenase (short-subunit alcohol dehydrogenase family)
MRDQVAIITGAGRGIGRVIGLRLGAAGARVVPTGPNAASLEQVAAEMAGLGYTAFSVVADVRHAEHVKRMAETVQGRFGRIDRKKYLAN